MWGKRASTPASVAGMLLLSIVSLQSGTALAKSLLTATGVVGIVFLRNAVASAVLWLTTRPSVRGYSRTHWQYAALLGVVTAGMNLAFYAAAARIPMGVAVAIDFLGPITVAVVKSRQRRQLVAPVLACMGIALLAPLGDVSAHHLPGIGFALCAAAGWGLYIILTARTSRLFGQTAGLTLATTFGSVALLPLLFFTDLSTLGKPSVLMLGALVSVASTAVPFALEFAVLRRMTERTFGILVSAEPVVAALIGLIALHQSLTGWEWAAVGVIVTAGVIAAGEGAQEPLVPTDLPTARTAVAGRVGTAARPERGCDDASV
jgi:inner membrane transporter RhtA